MGKIYYSAECDDTWGENESKYLFFFKEKDIKFVDKLYLGLIKWNKGNQNYIDREYNEEI